MISIRGFDKLIAYFFVAVSIMAFFTLVDPEVHNSLPETEITQEQHAGLRKEQVTIDKAIDGDTVSVVFSDGTKESVRLLLVDTPETVHPNKPAQPFGEAASDYTKGILKKGKSVTLEVGNPERDNYNRILGYIWVDGKNLNQVLLEKGLARVAYVYPPNTKYLDEFRKAEAKAKEKGIGIWSIKGYVTDRGFDTSVQQK